MNYLGVLRTTADHTGFVEFSGWLLAESCPRGAGKPSKKVLGLLRSRSLRLRRACFPPPVWLTNNYPNNYPPYVRFLARSAQ